MALERKHVTDEFIHLCKTSSSSQRLQVEVPPARFIYELCWTVVRGDLLVNKFRLAWESVDFAETVIEEDSASLLADTIAHMGQELTLTGEFRTRLIELAKWLVDNGLVSTRLLQERCEAEFLWEAEMIKIKAPDLKSKEVRVNTRLLYQQTKFNLLREESEGYAKLVTLLCRRGQEGSNKQRAAVVISTIKSLIGHFDLDPNRVFDIVLECYELQPQNADFLELIPLFPKSHTSHILGFKFQYYQRTEVNENVPNGLYILSATLIKENFIDLDSVLAHLLPADEDAFAEYEAFSKRHLDEANKIGKINLAATGKDLMEEEKPGDVTIDLFAALDIESEAILERSQEFSSNQKLGLLRGFLLIGDWHHAYILFERFANLNPVSSPQICDALFRSIENALASTYKLVRPPYLADLGGNITSSAGLENTTEDCSQSPEILELSKEFFQMLSCAGPYLYRDALLLQKVCRVLRGYLSSALSNASKESFVVSHQKDLKDPKSYLKEAQLRIQDALGNCLLPSLQLLPANPAVGLEIWEVMSLLPYEARYRLYGEWEKEDEKIPMIVAARQTAKLDTRRILKRLAKENLKQLGRMVAKIAHANPMTVLRTIVHQIEAYKDMITPVVDAFKYLTQLEYDILEYVVIERLAHGGRDKLKEDGLNLSDWLQSLAFFWGHLCKKYPSMELRGLFQYLVNKLKKDEGIELIVLQELIQQMANVEYTENVTEEQLEAMAGGESLRYHATAFGATRNNKALLKSTNRLRDSLLPKDEPKLAIPLLLLIAQHRSKVIINADAPYIKMVSERFDTCHGALLQYVEFLTNAVTPTTAYAQLVPSLDELLHKYHIEPEICFLIYRPVMRLFKPAIKVESAEASKNSSEVLSGRENWPLNSSNELVLDLGANRKVMMWSELLSTVHSILPSKSWNSLSPELYTTFWGLSLQDLFVPRKRYEAEIAKQHATLKALEESSDNSHTAITKRKKDKIKIQEVLDRLTSELEQQDQNAKAVHERLVKEKDSWLTSCPDLIKVNMEFLQRCIFPRCVVSMIDAIYCARFVHTLHSLGTPFFNTVNHIDVLICKTLQPMICSCTEYEAGRFGRFLYETLKMAYYWKSQEAIYDKECGNMPGFAVLYRDPNSARVTFSQFLRVHIKWSHRITKLLIQCLESTEYIEIRNALTILTKISCVFPVIKKTGVNLERRVNKIKSDERKDLKVLATGVSAALAARKSSWVTEDEFVMGLIDVKPTTSPAKISSAPSASASNVQLEHATQQGELIDQGRGTETGSGSLQVKSETTHSSVKPVSSFKDNLPLAQAAANAQAEASRSALSGAKHVDDVSLRTVHVMPVDENMTKVPQKHVHTENEGRARRLGQSTAGGAESAPRAVKLEAGKDESKLASNAPASAFIDREVGNRVQESVRQRPGSSAVSSTIVTNGTTVPSTSKNIAVERKGSEPSVKIRSTDATSDSESKKLNDIKNIGERETEISEVSVRQVTKSPLKEDPGVSKPVEEMPKEKVTKRSSLAEEIDRTTKRRKGDAEKSGEVAEYRIGERERIAERPRSVEHEKTFYEDRTAFDKSLDGRVERGRDRVADRTDREHRGARDEHANDRSRGKSMERFTRERSVERVSGFDRSMERSREERLKDERGRPRYAELTIEQPHADDRFPMQNLPPPPPLPPNVVPQSLPSNRREEDESRRAGRQPGRTSPRKDEKVEKRRSEDGSMNSVEDSRRKDEDSRDRKRDDRETPSAKVDKEREKDRDKEKPNMLKEEDTAAAISKRRRLKRDHISSEVPPNFGPSPPPPPPPPPTVVAQQYDRDRDRKNAIAMRNIYEEPGYDKGPNSRVHGKDIGKIPRREHDQPYERDWDEEKRVRGDIKRRHHR